jgi:protein SCO1/2
MGNTSTTGTLEMRRVISTVIAVALGGALSSASAQSAVSGAGASGKRSLRAGQTRVAPVMTGPLSAGDSAAIARRWGVEVEGIRLTSSGYMLDFRYRILDANKAAPLFVRKTKPVLKDDKSGVTFVVPEPPKTGALRSSNQPQANRTYFMFFVNPARFIKAGNTVTVTIGDFVVSGIAVLDEDEAQPTPKTTAGASHEGHEGQVPAATTAAVATHDGHEAHVAAAPPATPTGHEGHKAMAAAPVVPTTAWRVMAQQPVLADLTFQDQTGRTTSLRDAVGQDKPVLVNFIFTTCTTICPVMSAGFKQVQKSLGSESDHVRMVSISIDPELDTVNALQEYATRYGATPSWRFLTGTRAAVEAAQRTFGAFRGDKNNHAPATYLRRTSTSPWEVVDGLSSAETLLQGIRAAAPAPGL